MFARLTLPFAVMMGCGPAAALEFGQVHATESNVTFAYKQMGVPLDGRFSKFAVDLVFDPARTSHAKARIDVDVASIDTGSAENDEEVVGKKWFDAKAFTVASFVSSGVRVLGGNRYEALGKLSIKGKTMDVVAPFTFQPEGNRGVFDGAFILKRLDYAIGEGEWADVGTVANEVRINFHVVAYASNSKK
jgi:polyisoprenoid-binding protein YceI